jgi:hypothetical protein
MAFRSPLGTACKVLRIAWPVIGSWNIEVVEEGDEGPAAAN